MPRIDSQIWERERANIQSAILAGMKYKTIATKLEKPDFAPTPDQLGRMWRRWKQENLKLLKREENRMRQKKSRDNKRKVERPNTEQMASGSQQPLPSYNVGSFAIGTTSQLTSQLISSDTTGINPPHEYDQTYDLADQLEFFDLNWSSSAAQVNLSEDGGTGHVIR